jgi:hypothetical protein
MINEQKPRLHLLRGGRIAAEDLATFYTALTGKIVTPDALEQSRRALEQAYSEREAARSTSQRAEGRGDPAAGQSASNATNPGGAAMQISDENKKGDVPDKDKKVPPRSAGKKADIDYGRLTAEALNRVFPARRKGDKT